jgi:uncharacterized protein YggE
MRSIAVRALSALGILLLASLVVTCGSRDNGTAATTPTSTDTRTVTVSGEGRVARTPDVVLMTVGVDISRPDLTTAQSEASTTMDKVIGALKDRGVAEKDITTTVYSIYTDRDYSKPDSSITGYHVTHLVTAKVRDVAGAGGVLQAAIDAGANSVQGLSFGLDDTAAAVQDARAAAIADAKGKAQQLAQLTNATLGQVMTITEGTASTPYPAAMPATGSAGGKDVTINAGQTEVVVTVTVVWALQ